MKALFALSLLLPAACFADQWNKHFDFSGKPEVHVFAANLPVEVRAGDGPGVDVELKTEGFTIGPSQVHVDPKQEGNKLELRAYMPEQHFNWGHNSIHFVVRVPREALTTFVQSQNGPVSVRDVAGSAQIDAGNGPISLTGFNGSMEAHTGNGPVKVEGRFDGLQLRMGNGPLSLSVNGGSKLSSAWHVEAGNGPVEIKLPENVNADLSVHTGNGPLAFNLPVEGEQRDRHTIHGKLNGGGPELTIETGHGTVSIGRS